MIFYTSSSKHLSKQVGVPTPETYDNRNRWAILENKNIHYYNKINTRKQTYLFYEKENNKFIYSNYSARSIFICSKQL